jgi:adenosylcobinamide kinase/adenosylcobinamide-phosphate guanylyltransferase
MKELILGGVRSGKSRLAEQRARESERPVLYIATALAAGDAELLQRIRRHRERRPADWLTVEEPLALGEALRTHDAADRFIVVECLTLWLTNILCMAPKRLEHERSSLCAAIATLAADLVLVSNETGLGVVPLGPLSRRFVDASGELHQTLASLCERVTLTVAGLPLVLKHGES